MKCCLLLVACFLLPSIAMSAEKDSCERAKPVLLFQSDLNYRSYASFGDLFDQLGMSEANPWGYGYGIGVALDPMKSKVTSMVSWHFSQWETNSNNTYLHLRNSALHIGGIFQFWQRSRFAAFWQLNSIIQEFSVQTQSFENQGASSVSSILQRESTTNEVYALTRLGLSTGAMFWVDLGSWVDVALNVRYAIHFGGTKWRSFMVNENHNGPQLNRHTFTTGLVLRFDFP